MNALYAFYDGECGLCAAGRRWLMDQRQLVPIFFYPYQSPEALEICPVLPDLNPEREIVVMADTGEIYQGDSSWITLLWATAEWRSVAVDLSAPALRGLARRVVESVSQNRLTLSRWLGLRREYAVPPLPEAECTGGCRVPVAQIRGD